MNSNADEPTASTARWSRPVRWYRTPVDAVVLRQLQARSNARGALQTLGFLGLLLLLGAACWYSAVCGPWYVTLTLLFAYGTCFAFQINAVHELQHGTVFRTAACNACFLRLFAFLGWINHPLYLESHARHHQFTLHPPDDLEVVLPVRLSRMDFLRAAFVDPRYLARMTSEAWRLSRGRFRGEWELALFPPGDANKRRAPVRQARILLSGHACILLAAAAGANAGMSAAWMLPVLITLGKSYGGWLFFACNNAQHIATLSHVADFRQNSRTVLLNPFVRFLYWNMNFHVEHHMFTQVPCYRLPRLRRLIEYDLPPAPRGLVAAWRSISQDLRHP